MTNHSRGIYIFFLNNKSSNMKKQMTLIYYYVPEDKDDPQVPNVFGINIKKDDIRLKHLHENFPIAGEYIFRFKVLYENNIAWLDLPDPHAKIPNFKDKIMVKASRVSWETKRTAEKLTQPHQKKIVTNTTHTSPVNDHKVQSLNSRPELKTEKSPTKVQLQKKPTQSFNLIDDEHLHHSQPQSNGHNSDSLL